MNESISSYEFNTKVVLYIDKIDSNDK